MNSEELKEKLNNEYKFNIEYLIDIETSNDKRFVEIKLININQLFRVDVTDVYNIEYIVDSLIRALKHYNDINDKFMLEYSRAEKNTEEGIIGIGKANKFIGGYNKNLTEEEINQIKQLKDEADAFIKTIESVGVNKRRVSIAITNIETACMYAVKSITHKE